MAKTTTEKRISVEEQIEQLENQRKQLIQKEREEERKARTHRLCKRGRIVEKLLPELVTLTDEQFDVFVKQVLLTEQSKRIIAEIAVQKPTITANPEPDEAEHNEDTPNPLA